MIIFKKIKYKNFLSTGNVFTTIHLNKHRTTALIGKNGGGKSTVIESICFALFGKPFRKINKPQLINSITNSNLVTEIEFSVSNNEYRIVRGMKPALFEIYKNGTLLNQSSDSKDYQEILEKNILKINYKSFCQVVVLGSATFLPFMQLPAAQRREIIENLLDLEIFTSMNNILKEKVTENKELILKIDSEKKILEEKLKFYKDHYNNIKNNNETAIQEKTSILNETSTQIDILNQDSNKLLTSIEELKSNITNEDKVLSKIRTLDKLKNKIENNLDIINDEIIFFNNNDNCPTCKQKIQDAFKTETIIEKQSKIKDIEVGLEELKSTYKKTEDQLQYIKQIKSEIEQLRTEYSKTTIKASSLEKYKNDIQREIDKSKSISLNVEQSKIESLQNELNATIEQYNDLVKQKNILNVTSVLLKDGGIKTKIIKKYIPIINKTINKYLADLNFFVMFELDEEFNEKIKSRNRDEFSYSSFSEGEKMKIDLAILFTWRHIAKLRNSIHTNLLIMDEVFDSSLDADSVDDFTKIMKTFDEKTNMFIITHKIDQLSDKFDKILKFSKVKNFSKVT